MQPYSLVVVDDEPHIRCVLELKFVEAGFAVHSCTNGKSAYEHIRAHPPDAIVTDLQMPGTDGLELSTRLHEDPITASIPIVMLTARGHLIPREVLAQTNIKHVIGKPFSPRKLLALVTKLIETSDGHEKVYSPEQIDGTAAA